MPRFKLPLLVLLALSCLPVSALAQEQEPIVVRFSCLAWAKVDTHGLRYLYNGEAKALRISSAYRTGPYSYTGPNPIVFFREIDGPEGTKLRQPVGTARIPAGMREVLLLFIRNDQPEGSGNEYSIMVLDDSLGSFPKGSYRVFNLSDEEIGGIFGDQKFVVPSRDFRTVTLNSEDEVDVRIHFSSKVDGQWVPSVNTRWLYRDNMRSIVFVSEDNSSRYPVLKIKSITQYVED